ncbi:LytTR family DNA-binding domain-containing protein [Flavobacterium sp. NRK F10]|uniref:LytR/AlgR family response regulator transcription factor n=1 Tax=Flavobacterium sp. NRK F10 TaxID=2954931 RepID=UPI00209115FB|nr:LytTR family DNA-binding domain-containing protein [Flavobacterium sp. NRK F10]MCO6174575.1 LytTR family DNA-binding domain-containing protein [Flavobacterium sp. NRK F10]
MLKRTVVELKKFGMEEGKLSCLIVDDEPMALDLVERYVLKTPFLQLAGKCNSAVEALAYIEKEKVDVVFLDIQMPDLTGLEFAKVVPKSTRIIFTTAFNQYAIEGFKAEALDYLLKPFNYAEFLLAANKAKQWFALWKKRKENIKENSFFYVKSEYKQLKISFDEILYIEGLKDYVKIWLKDNPKPILTLMSLKSLEEVLPSDRFMRVHRSFIVSLSNVEVVERGQIVINKQRITVSEQYKPQFLAYINDNSLE